MLAKHLQMLALTLLVFLPAAGVHALVPCATAGTEVRAVSARALAPPGEGEPALAPNPSAPQSTARRVAADAPPSIGERRTRAVAMTVFSLGAVIGAGFLVGYLVKRLL